ncbi:MAG: hypothetical protein COB02_03365 [Candidatus Cloacimonadota bacterium]|nr:MAG: hypothetical protein COB02_03365 [Candidatus Cloacimonadota bacterium]
MKILNLYLTLIVLITIPSAMVKSIDLNFSPLDQISKNKYLHKQNIEKANLLLNSSKMDISFSLALKEILHKKVRPSNRFNMIQIKYKELEAPMQKELNKYSFLLNQQSSLFYDLTKSAHFNQLNKFNQSARKMLNLFKVLDQIEDRLKLK